MTLMRRSSSSRSGLSITIKITGMAGLIISRRQDVSIVATCSFRWQCKVTQVKYGL